MFKNPIAIALALMSIVGCKPQDASLQDIEKARAEGAFIAVDSDSEPLTPTPAPPNPNPEPVPVPPDVREVLCPSCKGRNSAKCELCLGNGTVLMQVAKVYQAYVDKIQSLSAKAEKEPDQVLPVPQAEKDERIEQSIIKLKELIDSKKAGKAEKVPAEGIEDINWVGDFFGAKKMAAETGKPVFIYITAEWCTFCQQMERTTFEDQEVVDYINEHFIALKLDRDAMKASTKADWKVSNIPDYIFVRSDWSGKDRPNPGYYPTGDFLKLLKQQYQNATTPPKAPAPAVKKVSYSGPIYYEGPVWYPAHQGGYYGGSCSSGNCGGGSCSSCGF